MAWSKVSKENYKPIKWWMHKILCEWGWIVRNKDNYKTYYHHLNMCLMQGFNLYGNRT